MRQTHSYFAIRAYVYGSRCKGKRVSEKASKCKKKESIPSLRACIKCIHSISLALAFVRGVAHENHAGFNANTNSLPVSPRQQ